MVVIKTKYINRNGAGFIRANAKGRHQMTETYDKSAPREGRFCV